MVRQIIRLRILHPTVIEELTKITVKHCVCCHFGLNYQVNVHIIQILGLGKVLNKGNNIRVKPQCFFMKKVLHCYYVGFI